jgi:hypothetical protein
MSLWTRSPRKEMVVADTILALARGGLGLDRVPISDRCEGVYTLSLHSSPSSPSWRLRSTVKNGKNEEWSPFLPTPEEGEGSEEGDQRGELLESIPPFHDVS